MIYKEPYNKAVYERTVKIRAPWTPKVINEKTGNLFAIYMRVCAYAANDRASKTTWRPPGRK